jgi:hypothetical protein
VNRAACAAQFSESYVQVSVVRPNLLRELVQVTLPVAVEDCPAVLLTFSVTV